MKKDSSQAPDNGSLGVTESACQRRPEFDPWVRKIAWKRKGQPTPVLLPGKSYGQRSLAVYSPWGHKELDMTLQLHTHTIFIEHILILCA